MTQEAFNPQHRLKKARSLVDSTAAQLHEMVAEMASQLVPFPYFLGSTEVQAIEAEPGGVQNAERGCVVVCADGEMYEFSMKMQAPGPGMEFGMEREDSVKPVDLPPAEYIVYALNALKEMAGLIEDSAARRKKYSF